MKTPQCVVRMFRSLGSMLTNGKIAIENWISPFNRIGNAQEVREDKVYFLY